MDLSASANSQTPSRHWAFGAWLIFASIINFFVAAFLLNIFGVINLVFIFAIYKWRKWGFYGFTVLAAVFCVLNVLCGVEIVSAIRSLIAPAILCVVLNVGGEKKSWPQLK